MTSLQETFDNEPMESQITNRCPGINGVWITAVELSDGAGVIEKRTEKPLPSGTYKYKQLSAHDIEIIKSLEFDPYNDADYSCKLIDFWDSL